MAEHITRNDGVVGSIPTTSSSSPQAVACGEFFLLSDTLLVLPPHLQSLSVLPAWLCFGAKLKPGTAWGVDFLSLDLQTVFLNLLELFLLIGAGYGVVRWGALPASASSAFSGLLMNVTLPATILTSLEIGRAHV